MNIFIKMMLAVFFISSNIYAYDAMVDFSKDDQFSIDGYDFFKKDESLPILVGKIYDLVEEGEEVLVGESYRKLIRITDPVTLEYDIFTTRIINNTKKAIVEEIKETYRGDSLYYANFDEYGSWYRSLDLSHAIVLEDGGLLTLNTRLTALASERNIYRYEVPLLPGDQIEILWEEAPSDFAATSFRIKITRNETLIGIFGNNISRWKSESVMGIQREDNLHYQSNILFLKLI